jgi:hypothetical protein
MKFVIDLHRLTIDHLLKIEESPTLKTTLEIMSQFGVDERGNYREPQEVLAELKALSVVEFGEAVKSFKEALEQVQAHLFRGEVG